MEFLKCMSAVDGMDIFGDRLIDADIFYKIYQLYENGIDRTVMFGEIKNEIFYIMEEPFATH